AGSHLDHRVERHRPGLLALGYVDLGRGDGVDVALAERAGVVLGQRVAQCLATRAVGAEAGLEDAARRLARAEPGDANLAGDLPERGLDGLVELLLVDPHRELDLVALEGLDAGLHPPASLPTG